MNNRIVITGMGAISGLGSNTKEFWSALRSGRSAIAPLPSQFDDVRVSLGCMIPGYDETQYFSKDELPLLDKFSQLAVLASREAVLDAGFSINDERLIDAAAIIGSGAGGRHTDEEIYHRLYKEQRSRAHPLAIPKGMHSAPASMVSLHIGIKGPVFSLAAACASSGHAVAQGSMMIQSGQCDVALVGGTDTPFTYGLLKVWEALRVASNDSCRPFSKDRSGLVLGEGSGMLVLESEEHAKQRGARIYAELAGSAMSADAGHITRPDVTNVAKVMTKALKQANVVIDEVDYINAHGTGTQMNDLSETQAIHLAFGSHAKKLAISSTKSLHGHVLGASSALELISSVYTINHSCIPPTANYTEADEGCDLDYVPNIAREQEVNVVLSNSFGFGGLNAVLVLKKYTN